MCDIIMTSSTELVQQLQDRLHSESVSRQRQEKVNAKLQDEYDLLLKRLAEAELHIDRLRLGVSVDVSKRAFDSEHNHSRLERHTGPISTSDSPYRHDDTTTQHIQGNTDTDDSHHSLRSPLQNSDSQPSAESLSATDISQMSPTSVANRATAESIQMAHLFQIHNLQEQISVLKEKIVSGTASVGEVMASLWKIQQEHQQLAQDIESSSVDLDALNQKYEGRPSSHIARSQEAVGEELSDLAEKLRELEELLKTKAENLLDSPSIATPPHDEGHSPSPNMSLSATESAEIHTRRPGVTEQDLSNDSLDSPILPSKYLTEIATGTLPDHTPLEAGSSLSFAKQEPFQWKEGVPQEQDVRQSEEERTPPHEGDTSSELTSSFVSEQSTSETRLPEQRQLSSSTLDEDLSRRPPSHTQRGKKKPHDRSWIPRPPHVESGSLSVSSEQSSHCSRKLSATIPPSSHIRPHTQTQSPPHSPSLSRPQSSNGHRAPPTDHTHIRYPNSGLTTNSRQSPIAPLPSSDFAIPGEADSGFAGSELPPGPQGADIAQPSTVASSDTSGEEEKRIPSITTAAIDTLRAELAELKQQILNSPRPQLSVPSSPRFYSPYPRNPLHTDKTPTQRGAVTLERRFHPPAQTSVPSPSTGTRATEVSTSSSSPYALTGHQPGSQATTTRQSHSVRLPTPLTGHPLRGYLYKTGTEPCAHTHSSETETSSTVSIPSGTDLNQWICRKCGEGAMATSDSPKQKHKHRHKQKRGKSALMSAEDKSSQVLFPLRDEEQGIRHGGPPLGETATGVGHTKRHVLPRQVLQFSSESSGSELDSSPHATTPRHPSSGYRRPPSGLDHTQKVSSAYDTGVSYRRPPMATSTPLHFHKHRESRQPTHGDVGDLSHRRPNRYPREEYHHRSSLRTPGRYTGRHTSPPGRYTGSYTSPPGRYTGRHTSPPGRYTGRHTSPPGRYTGRHTSPPGRYTGRHTSPPGRYTGRHTSPPGRYTGSHTSPTGRYTGSHTSPPGRYTGSYTSPPGRYTGRHTSPPGRYTGSHTSPPGRYTGSHTSPTGRYTGSHTSPYHEVSPEYNHLGKPHYSTSPKHTPRERARYVRVSCGEEVYFSDPNHSPRRRKSVYVRPTSVKELYLVEDHSYYSSDSEVEVLAVSPNLGDVCSLARKLRRRSRKMHGALDRELDSYRRRTTLY